MPTVASLSPTPACAAGRLVRGWLIAALLCQAAPLAAQVAAGSQAAQHVVQHATERFFAAIEREGERAREPERAHALVEQHILPHVDTELVARLILGRHWRTASEQQRARFIDAFKWMLLRTYSIAVEDFSGVDIRYLPAREEPRDGEVEVRTQISHKGGPPVAVNYRMHQRDGEWLAFDLVIQGVSMVATYRGTFAAEINRHGLDGLIERIGQHRAAAADTSG